MPLRLGIRAKVLSVLAASLIVIFGIMSYFVIQQNTNVLETGLEERTKTFAQLATKPIGDTYVLYQDSGSLRISQQMNRFLKLDSDVTGISIVNISGQQIFGSRGSQVTVNPAQLTSFQARYEYNKHGRINQIIQPYIEDSGAHRYAVVYNVSDQRVTTALQQTIRLILYVAVAVLAVSLAATSLLMNVLFLRPLAKVSRQATSISQGNWDQTIDASRRDEIGDVGRSVNAMAEALKANIVKLREVDQLKSEFLMITSHNLRTPLSIMSGYAEMANETDDPQKLKQTLQAMSVNVLRLQLFAEDVLAISTLESGHALKREPIVFKPFITTLSDEFKRLAEEKELDWKFEADLPEDTKVSLNQHHIRSALGNIYDNAIKFTPHGGSITIRAKTDDKQIHITVQDSGIGIAASEIPKLFTKFHRGTSTLQYDYEGVGIGLYLTKLIIEQHDGTITINSREHDGTTVTISLPLASD